MSNVGRSLSLEGIQMNVLYSIICEYFIIFEFGHTHWKYQAQQKMKMTN